MPCLTCYWSILKELYYTLQISNVIYEARDAVLLFCQNKWIIYEVILITLWRGKKDSGHASLLPYVLIIEIFCIINVWEENSFCLKILWDIIEKYLSMWKLILVIFKAYKKYKTNYKNSCHPQMMCLSWLSIIPSTKMVMGSISGQGVYSG